MSDYGENLIAELKASDEWPLKRERHYRHIVADRRALRRGDRTHLKRMAHWDRHNLHDGSERDYVVDPLAKRIADGFADFLYGEDPSFVSEQYQDDLDQVVSDNKLAAGLHRAERAVAAEGEYWYKIHTNDSVSQSALLEWRSRLSCVPSFYGERLLAVAFVTDVCREAQAVEKDESPAEIVWRHVEVHCALVVRNLLFKGTSHELGDERPLEERPETADVDPEWAHDLPILAGRIVNDLDDDDHLGASEFDQVKDLLLALNEAATISVENARLTGKDRIFVAGRFRELDGSWDASMEVLEVEDNAQGATLGEGGSKGAPPVFAIEKHYDAQSLWFHITKIVHTILTRVGLVAKFIGDDTAGGTDASGRSIRLQFLPTVNAARGKAREWDAMLPKIVDLLLRVGALPVEQGGFGRDYQPDGLPSVARGDVLPVDEGETIQDNGLAVTAEIRSRHTAIKALNPDWTEDEVTAELKAIRDETALQATTLDRLPLPPPPGLDKRSQVHKPKG